MQAADDAKVRGAKQFEHLIWFMVTNDQTYWFISFVAVFVVHVAGEPKRLLLQRP